MSHLTMNQTAKMTTLQLLAAADYEKRNQKPLEELVPEQYHEYLHLFKEETTAKFPPSRPYDHKIELKEGFKLKIFKMYLVVNALCVRMLAYC